MPSPASDAPPAPRRMRFTVPPDQAGQTLLVFLCARYPFIPDAGWVERISRRSLVVNGLQSHEDRLLITGDLLEYLDEDIPEPNVNTDIGIVYQDEHFLAVNKPSGLPCHPGGRYYRNTLTELVRTLTGLSGLILINRLDRETSGLVLLACDRIANKNIQKQFERRQVEKRYVVFVEGAFPDTLETAGYIVPDLDSVVRKRRRFIPSADGQPAPVPPPDGDWAVTRFTRLWTHAGISELEVRPATGRQHQIRASLLAVGFPVVGDKLYGRDPAIFLRFCNNTLTPADRQDLRLDRQALHAAGLRLRHPRTQEFMDLEAPLAKDLADWVQRLGVPASDRRV